MKRVEKILSDLVSYSVLGGESNLSIIAYISEFLNNHGVEYHLIEKKEEEKASIFCRIGPAVDGGIILSAHTDVVPVKGQDWNTDPFELVDNGDKLYARGSADMKGFIACCLSNVDKMTRSNLQKPFYLAFSYDEEIGCLGGQELADGLRDYYDEKPSGAIIGEPSLMQPVVGQKGICIYETTVNGSAGHSSRIKQEVSAIHEAIRLASWLESKMDQLIQSGHIDDRFHPNHTSIHVGTFNGGIAPNVIADQCTFHWDVRTIPMDHPETILREFNDFCNEREEILRRVFPDFKITTSSHQPVVPHLDTEVESNIVDLVTKLSGNKELQTVSYASEAGQFATAGFESIICGPGDIEQAHRADEFISKDQLEKGEKFISNLVDEFAP